jgi:hypothetical protein
MLNEWMSNDGAVIIVYHSIAPIIPT